MSKFDWQEWGQYRLKWLAAVDKQYKQTTRLPLYAYREIRDRSGFHLDPEPERWWGTSEVVRAPRPVLLVVRPDQWAQLRAAYIFSVSKIILEST